MKKKICTITKTVILSLTLILIILFGFTGCEWQSTGTQVDTKKTIEIANILQENQPTPTDIDYSLERYNLIRRAYWVNGQRERAKTVPCPIADIPLGYIILFADNGSVIGRFVVEGKVTSLNSFLTPDSEYYEKHLEYNSGTERDARPTDKYSNKWLVM